MAREADGHLVEHLARRANRNHVGHPGAHERVGRGLRVARADEDQLEPGAVFAALAARHAGGGEERRRDLVCLAEAVLEGEARLFSVAGVVERARAERHDGAHLASVHSKALALISRGVVFCPGLSPRLTRGI